MYTCRRKWQEWISLWIRSSSVARCAWKCCGSRSPFPADTVIVWSALKVTGGNVSWKRNTAALSADAPLVLNLCYVETPCWLMLWKKLRRTGVQDAGGKAADVECDVCTGKKHRAVRFCVKCQTFYCEMHLKHHNERNRGRTHPLTEVTKQPQKRICSRHNKLRDAYCRTDQQCICSLCFKDGHKGHSVVTVMEERMDIQVTKTVEKSVNCTK